MLGAGGKQHDTVVSFIYTSADGLSNGDQKIDSQKRGPMKRHRRRTAVIRSWSHSYLYWVGLLTAAYEDGSVRPSFTSHSNRSQARLVLPQAVKMQNTPKLCYCAQRYANSTSTIQKAYIYLTLLFTAPQR